MYLEAVGQHTVQFKAVGNDDYNDSLSNAYQYETKAVSLTLTKTESNKASVAFVGMKVMKGEQEFTEAEITVQQTETVTLKAVGGYDAEHKIFYAGEDQKSLELIVKVDLAKPQVSAPCWRLPTSGRRRSCGRTATSWTC